MWKILAALSMAGLFAYIIYNRAEAPTDSRTTIEANIEQVKRTAKLDPAQEQLVRVQLAISDHIAASNGVPPQSLQELVPKYFDQVPTDPATGEAIKYERAGLSYRLGAETSGSTFGQTSNVDAAKGKQGELAAGIAEDFVNPNTMQLDDFVYDPAGKRNPFEPFDFSNKVAVDETLPPLQRYTLGQLKVTAVLSDTKGLATAIVEDAVGKGYAVKVGTKIGSSNGVIESIEKDRINVVESFTDFTGKTTTNAVVMKLQVATPKDKKR